MKGIIIQMQHIPHSKNEVNIQPQYNKKNNKYFHIYQINGKKKQTKKRSDPSQGEFPHEESGIHFLEPTIRAAERCKYIL